MYHFFIGIDISKDTFTVALHGENRFKNYPNHQQGFAKFCKDYKNYLPKAFNILETTGGYEVELIHYLQAKQFYIHRANTRKVKNFIRSYGVMAKTDSMDAFGLALYGFERHAKLELYQENPHKCLLKLVQRRNDLKFMLVQEKNRSQAPDQKEFERSFQVIIKAIQSEMQVIQNSIDELCKQYPCFDQLKKVLTTLEGIGDITAVQLIAHLPELGKIDGKKIASLAGLAPHPKQSGKKEGHRTTSGGRADIKPVLFIAAMSASRTQSKLGDFYRKLVQSGKKKMVALTALMRKMLVIANAKIRDFLLTIPNSQHG